VAPAHVCICNYTVPSVVTNCAAAQDDKTFLIWEEYGIYKYWCRTAVSNTRPTSSVFFVSFIVPPVSLLQTISTLNLISYADIT